MTKHEKIDFINYDTQDSDERARICKDRLVSVESEHLGLVADHLAGREVDQALVTDAANRIGTLKDAIKVAEGETAPPSES